jgi:Uma2 family endonuclease
MAYIRTKKVKGKEYQYLVEGYRDERGKVKQRIIEYLGAVKDEDESMVTTDTKITFSEYLNYEDGTDNRYELVDGELVRMNPPAKRHFNITRFLVRLMTDEILRDSLDIEVFTGIGVRTGLNSSRIPDVTLVDGEQWRNLDLDASAVIETRVLLVVEVVSPGEKQISRDYIDKVAEYRDTGIAEYWIVDPIEGKISVLVLEKGEYSKTVFTGDDAILSVTFPQLNFTAGEILNA